MGLLHSYDVTDRLLIFICEARSQKCLLNELHTELGVFGLEILILFSSGMEFKKSYFGGDREGIENATAVS